MDKLQTQSIGFADGFNVEFERRGSKMTPRFGGVQVEEWSCHYQNGNDSRRQRFQLKDRNYVLDMLSLECLSAIQMETLCRQMEIEV